MKTIFLKSGPWITLVLGFSSLVLLLQLNLVNRVDEFFSRQEFEEFLHRTIAGWLQLNNSEESGQPPRSDLPDQAALQDYLNTVDADEKHVPRKHPRQIYDSPRANEKKTTLKSGSNLHWQGKEANFAGRVWAGGVTRGLWYKENSTNRSPWIPLDDFWSRNCMTCDPNNRTSFFIGTGEGQTAKIIYRESSGLGCGIQRSGYAGKTCSFRPGKENFECVSDIAVRYQAGTSVLCAAVVPGVY
jgi:hypothetical protein